MRMVVCVACLVALPSHGLGEGLGRTKKYTKTDVPKTITATTADVICIVEGVKPCDIKTFKASSDNPDVKVRAVEMDGEVRIIITGDKAAEAKIGWGYTTKEGKDGGYIGLEVKIE